MFHAAEPFSQNGRLFLTEPRRSPAAAGFPRPEGPARELRAAAVKQAYKELAKLHHPDRETGNLERFQAISKAWQEYQKRGRPDAGTRPAGR